MQELGREPNPMTKLGAREHAAAIGEGRHPGVRDALQWLTYGHLPPVLQRYSAPFYLAAVDLVTEIREDSPELTTALNKLVEAKDSAVRAGIKNDTGRAGSVPRPQKVVDPPTFPTRPIRDNPPGMSVLLGTINDMVSELDPGEASSISDGHHTFAELYAHRRALTAVLAAAAAGDGDSWRSKRHHPDGDPMFEGGYFIVGIELPTGTITYHYKLKYWDDFAAVPEIEHAPRWDGATPDDTVTRLLDTARLVADGEV